MSNTSSEVDKFLDDLGPPSIWGRPLTEDQANILRAAVAAGHSYKQIARKWREVYGWGSASTLSVRYKRLMADE